MIQPSRFAAWHTRVEPHESEDAWRAARRTMIGASDTAGIFGCGYAGQSALSVWMDKTGHELPTIDEETRDLLETGKEMEPIILRRLVRKTGMMVDRIEHTIFRHPTIDWLGASLDGVLLDEDCGWIPLELKNLTWRMYGDWGDWEEPDWEPPLKYQCQLQHQMAATGTPACYLAALFGGEKLVWRKVLRSETFIERALLPGLRQFWHQVQSRTMPGVDGQQRTRQLLTGLFGEDDGQEVILPDEAIEIDRELIELEEKAATLKTEIEFRKNQIRAWIGNASRGRLSIGGGWSWKLQSRKGYYVEPSESRVLRRFKS